ncbi:hypothetical protein GCM10027614_62640 [Micromonospora vulcania]
MISAVYRLRDYLGATFDTELREMVLGLTEQVASTWHLPDRGMWETRDTERHYLSSKVLCWVTMDRAVRLADRLGTQADPRRWARVRDEIREVVLREGWNERIGAFTGAFGSPELDASASSCRWRTSCRPPTPDALDDRDGGAGVGHRERAAAALDDRPGRLPAVLVLAGGVPGDDR